MYEHCVVLRQNSYASNSFRVIISFIIQASKKWSNIVNFILNLIKNAEFSYNFEVQKR